MENLKLPENYQAIMPYLIIPDAIKFFEFTKVVFGAEELRRTMRDEDTNVVMHGEVSIHGSTIMFANSTNQYSIQNAGMFVYVANCDETYKKAINYGCENIMPPANQSYGRSSGVKDPFGNTWWITSAL